MFPLSSIQKSQVLSAERTGFQGFPRIVCKERGPGRIPIILVVLFAMALLPAFGAGNGYNGGRSANPQDLKKKKIVLADAPKLAGGELKPGDTGPEAGRLEKLKRINGSQFLLVPPLVFSKGNIDQFDL
jgi:hypothetical protein